MKSLFNYIAKEKIKKNYSEINFHVSREAVSIKKDTHNIFQIEVKIADNSWLLTRFPTKNWGI